MDIAFFEKDLKFKCRVSGIVIEDNKLLLEKYDNDKYCLPGGHVELNETSEKAIIREMKEETGLDFEVDKFFGIAENFFVNKKNQKTHCIDFYYFLKGKNIKEKLNTSYIEYGEYSNIKHDYIWVELSDLKEYKLVPEELKNYLLNKSYNFHIIIEK